MFRVSLVGDVLTVDRGDGSVEAVTWPQLRKVWIQTTSDGPFSEDVFFVFEDASAGAVVPQGELPGWLFDKLQTLPGFDNEALIAAMGCCDDGTFMCWQALTDL